MPINTPSHITVNTGGSLTGSNNWHIGSNDNPSSSGGTGTINIGGGNVQHTGGWFIVGSGNGTVGEVNLTSGILNISGSINLGEGTNSQGTITVSGGSLNVAGDFNIGRSAAGTGTLDVSGSGGIAASTIKLTDNATSTGTITLGNGTSGGILVAKQITSTAGATSSFIFNGGSLYAHNIGVVETGSGDFLSANLQTFEVQSGGGTVNTNNKNISFGRAFTGSGDLTKAGNGTLTLKGDYTGYTGQINVTGGNIAFAEGSKILFTLDSAQAAATNVYTFANGSNVALNDSVILQINWFNADGLYDGQTISLFDGDSVNIANAGNIQIQTANTDFNFSLTSDGNLLVAAIPEPSTYALLGAIGLLGIVAVRRRRK